MTETNISLEILNELKLPEGIKVRHALGVGNRVIFCDGPAVLGGVSETKCGIRCAMPTIEDLVDIRTEAISNHRRIQLNNNRIQQ